MNNIIQGLLFLSTKYPNGKIEGGNKCIDFIISENSNPFVSLKDVTYLESLGWDEYDVDSCNSLGQTEIIRVWRFYTSLEVRFENE